MLFRESGMLSQNCGRFEKALAAGNFVSKRITYYSMRQLTSQPSQGLKKNASGSEKNRLRFLAALFFRPDIGKVFDLRIGFGDAGLPKVCSNTQKTTIFPLNTIVQKREAKKQYHTGTPTPKTSVSTIQSALVPDIIRDEPHFFQESRRILVPKRDRLCVISSQTIVTIVK